jgi:hypothetical protein
MWCEASAWCVQQWVRARALINLNLVLPVQSTRSLNVVQALMESVTLSQPQPKFPPELIKFLAKVHSAWHVAIPLLETHVIIFPDETRCFHALAELYRLVDEDDLLYGLWKNKCASSRAVGTLGVPVPLTLCKSGSHNIAHALPFTGYGLRRGLNALHGQMLHRVVTQDLAQAVLPEPAGRAARAPRAARAARGRRRRQPRRRPPARPLPHADAARQVAGRGSEALGAEQVLQGAVRAGGRARRRRAAGPCRWQGAARARGVDPLHAAAQPVRADARRAAAWFTSCCCRPVELQHAAGRCRALPGLLGLQIARMCLHCCQVVCMSNLKSPREATRCRWDELYQVATTCQNPRLSLDCQWRLGRWDELVNSLQNPSFQVLTLPLQAACALPLCRCNGTSTLRAISDVLTSPATSA